MTNIYTSPPVSMDFKWSTVVGNKLQEPTCVNVNAANWKYPNSFYLEGYIDQAGGEFPKPQMQIVDKGTTGATINLEVTQIDTVNDRIYFQFQNDSGMVFGGYALSELHGIISVSVLINA